MGVVDPRGMPRSFRLAPRAGLTLVCGALALLSVLILTSSAQATAAFPITEGFRNTTVGPEWKSSGSTALTATAPGNGWLRLTGAVNNQFGAMVNDNAFDSNRGVLAEFEYATYGGTGADGLVFFLYDGTTDYTNFHTGPAGGSIGYTNCPGSSTAGLSGAYIGVAFDEWGNFANQQFCNQNGGLPGNLLRPGRVVIRGGVANNYQYLDSKLVGQGLVATRAEARKIKVAITPDMKLSVFITFPDGEVQTVTSNFALPSNVPPTLKMGFVAATGGSNNVHEIRSTNVTYPANLNTDVTDGAAGSARGGHTWTATVSNSGPNPVTDAAIRATAPQAGLSNITWTCAADPGANCDALSGTGLPNTTADLPSGMKVTYTLQADIDPAQDYAQLRFAADHQAGSDTGELDPTDNASTDTTYLTPLLSGATQPAFTLAANGTATATTDGTTWLGGSISYARQWQRCDIDGTNCADIAGATANAYSTVAADQGHTLRLKVTADNPAGSTDAFASAFSAIPDTSIVSGPAARVATTTADIAFSQTGGGAGTVFECSLDGGAYAACVSPRHLTGLAAGPHAFSVRAVYGGLTDPSPATTSWTVDLDAELTVTGPLAGETATNQPTVTGTGEPGSTVTIKVDGVIVATGVVALDGTFAIQLPAKVADGERTIKVSVVDPVGNAKESEVTLTVDATSPDAPAIPSGPATTSGTPEATFTFDGEPGSTLECSLDGGDWKVCSSPLTLTGLGDGPHTLSVIAIDRPGNKSPRRDHTWTVDTAKPAAPAVMTGPERKTKDTNARFDVGIEPGATLECSLDGATFVPCTSPIELKDLAPGKHSLLVRQIDAAGNPSDAAAFEWEVVPKTPQTAPPSKVSARISTIATATGNRTVGVGCKLDQPGLESCSVKAYVVVDGKKILVGTGTVRGAGKSGGLVPVKLSARGRKLVGRAVGGLKVRLDLTARTGSVKGLTAHSSTVLYPQALAVVPTINPFDFDRAQMNTASKKAIKALARQLTHAKSVRCVGNTDSVASAAYNYALGLRRAQTVCAALKQLGVKGTRAASAGESTPRTTNATDAGRRTNRRVELKISY
jgi:hypothetical protein